MSSDMGSVTSEPALNVLPPGGKKSLRSVTSAMSANVSSSASSGIGTSRKGVVSASAVVPAIPPRSRGR